MLLITGPGSLGFKEKKVKKSIRKSKKKGMSRAQSIKWFQEVETKKGSGLTDDGGFQQWFHGIISRMDSEKLLREQPDGTFLIRVAESRYGYSLSLMFRGRVKHFMIDQVQGDRYKIIGNERTFPALNEIVNFHSKKSVTDDGDKLIKACPTEGPRQDLAELKK